MTPLLLVLMLSATPAPPQPRIIVALPASCWVNGKLTAECGATFEEDCARTRERNKLPEAKCIAVPLR